LLHHEVNFLIMLSSRREGEL